MNPLLPAHLHLFGAARTARRRRQPQLCLHQQQKHRKPHRQQTCRAPVAVLPQTVWARELLRLMQKHRPAPLAAPGWPLLRNHHRHHHRRQQRSSAAVQTGAMMHLTLSLPQNQRLREKKRRTLSDPRRLRCWARNLALTASGRHLPSCRWTHPPQR